MSISPRTAGAWIISHTSKLQMVVVPGHFKAVKNAGQVGKMLSVISATKQDTLSQTQLDALATDNNVSVWEMKGILDTLEKRKAIQTSKSGNGIDVLGLTHGSVLERTAAIFDDLKPTAEDRALLAMSEEVSKAPVPTKDMETYVSDTFKIDRTATKELLRITEESGLIDAEELDATTHERLYYNGNIFRIKDAKKTKRVLDSLTAAEQVKVREFDQKLSQLGFTTVEEARNILDPKLFEKLQAIALYDVNRVANNSDEEYFVTRPGSFAKFGNPFEEDTVDYAKALVSSLAYGMTRSTSGRGKIEFLKLLLNKLISGAWLGANTAAGQDYKYLEMKRVIQTVPGERFGHHMRLLKTEVGVVALEVLTSGDGSSEGIMEKLPASPISIYSGPEENRSAVLKKKKVTASARVLGDLLQSVRTGKI